MRHECAESSSFIFLSGRGRSYSSRIRAHVLKGHLKKRKENSLVRERTKRKKAQSADKWDVENYETTEVALPILGQRGPQSQVRHVASMSDMGDQRIIPWGGELSPIRTAREYAQFGTVLVEPRDGPNFLVQPKASKTLYSDLTERQAYLFHHCLSPLEIIGIIQTDDKKFLTVLPRTYSEWTLSALGSTP
jgi:hypothetical protein